MPHDIWLPFNLGKGIFQVVPRQIFYLALLGVLTFCPRYPTKLILGVENLPHCVDKHENCLSNPFESCFSYLKRI